MREAAAGSELPHRWIGNLRPGFMGVTVAVALFVSPSFGLLAEHYADPSLAAQTLERHAEQMVREDLERIGWQRLAAPGTGDATALLSDRQGVELLHATRPFRLELLHGPLTATPAPPADLARAASIVVRELSRYPDQSLRHARLRRVLLCRQLAEDGKPIPSLPNYQQTLLLDVDSSNAFLGRLVHHEVFHFIDYADDDQVRLDPHWEGLNDPYFVYGSGGRRMREPGSSHFTSALPGFLSAYSVSALEEDKAEVFSFLMTAPQAVHRTAEIDPIVRRKVDAIRSQVTARLPDFSDRFWSEIENSQR